MEEQQQHGSGDKIKIITYKINCTRTRLKNRSASYRTCMCLSKYELRFRLLLGLRFRLRRWRCRGFFHPVRLLLGLRFGLLLCLLHQNIRLLIRSTQKKRQA